MRGLLPVVDPSAHPVGRFTRTCTQWQRPAYTHRTRCSATAGPDSIHDQLTELVQASLNLFLDKPIQEIPITYAHGQPCIETTTTLILQRTLQITVRNILHGALH